MNTTSQIPSIITENSIGLFFNGKMHNVNKDHPNFDKIKECLKTGNYDSLERLIDIPKSVTVFAHGLVTVDNGVVMYNGVAIHNVLTRRILALMNEGFGFGHMVKFLENLKENSSMRAIDQLYTFLEHKALPITEDGHFLAYKAVRQDYMDKWTGKTHKNIVGAVVTMPRNEVIDNPDIACGPGLHCGANEYVKDYHSGDDRIVIVKVHPRDVVSVPVDMGCKKLRTCRYEVVAEMVDHDKILEKAVYTSDAEEMDQEQGYENDYEGEENEDDYYDSTNPEGEASNSYTPVLPGYNSKSFTEGFTVGYDDAIYGSFDDNPLQSHSFTTGYGMGFSKGTKDKSNNVPQPVSNLKQLVLDGMEELRNQKLNQF